MGCQRRYSPPNKVGFFRNLARRLNLTHEVLDPTMVPVLRFFRCEGSSCPTTSVAVSSQQRHFKVALTARPRIPHTSRVDFPLVGTRTRDAQAPHMLALETQRCSKTVCLHVGSSSTHSENKSDLPRALKHTLVHRTPLETAKWFNSSTSPNTVLCPFGQNNHPDKVKDLLTCVR